jgi:hypothetical protein
MILHLGGDTVVPMAEIIAIIDMQTVSQANTNREFIQIAEEEGFVKYISDDPPKSFVLAEVNKKTVLFMSPISAATLLKRCKDAGDSSLDMLEIRGTFSDNTTK